MPEPRQLRHTYTRVMSILMVLIGVAMLAVTFSSGKTATATIVGRDSANDIAVLQAAGVSGLTAATLATATLSVGQTVLAIGNPLGCS